MNVEMVREHRFDAGAVEINYAEGPPNGPPVVVLHGGAVSWRNGSSFVEALSQRFHVYAPDLRGHGMSGHVPRRYRLRDYVADTAQFLTHVVAEPAILYGHSLGGEVGIMVAAEHPDCVRALIVGDAPLSWEHHPTEEPTHQAINVLWRSLAGMPIADIVTALKAMPVSVPGEDVLRSASTVFGEDSPWFALQAMNLNQLDPDVLTAVLAGPRIMLEGYEPEAILPRISCPVLLLQADPAAGGLLSVEDVQIGLQLLKSAAHVQLLGVDRALHALPENIPTVVGAIIPFLQRV